MKKICEACDRPAGKLHVSGGARVCVACAGELKEAFGGPETMRSPGPRTLRGVGLPGPSLGLDDDAPDTELDWVSDPEACPGCGSRPGDGITPGCDDPMGCGHNRRNQEDALGPSTMRSPVSPAYVKGESVKFDGDAYMEETIRLEEARKRKLAAPTTRDSVGHVRQSRTQELPQNRIRIGK